MSVYIRIYDDNVTHKIVNGIIDPITHKYFEEQSSLDDLFTVKTKTEQVIDINNDEYDVSNKSCPYEVEEIKCNIEIKVNTPVVKKELVSIRDEIKDTELFHKSIISLFR